MSLPGIVAIAIAARSFAAERAADSEPQRNLDWLSLSARAGAGRFRNRPQAGARRGWLSGMVLGLLGASVILGGRLHPAHASRGAIRSSISALSAGRNFAAGCVLSFALGVGLFGMVYLMPVFLSFVRGHGPLRIGEIMLVTGAAQLLMAPVAVQLERHVDARWLTVIGFTIFAIGLGLSTSADRRYRLR